MFNYPHISVLIGGGNTHGTKWEYQTNGILIEKGKINDKGYFIGFNYGWDTLDDTVFPTKGSVFKTDLLIAGLNRSIDEDFECTGLNTNYTKYWGFSKNTIALSLNNNTQFYNDLENTLNSESLMGFKYIRTIRKKAYNKKIINASWGLGIDMMSYHNSERDKKSKGNIGCKAGLTFETSFGVFNFLFEI